VGDIYDTGYPKDKGKPNSKKGEYAPANETANDDIDNETHMTPWNRIAKISLHPSLLKRGINPPFGKGRLGGIL
jgi:hypothetical protein